MHRKVGIQTPLGERNRQQLLHQHTNPQRTIIGATTGDTNNRSSSNSNSHKVLEWNRK